MSEDMDTRTKAKTIEQALRNRGVRWTGQRQAIIEALVNTEEHLTAEELLHASRAIDESVSAPTVYRTLNLLVEAGMVSKRVFQGDSACYELLLGKGHHHHLIDVESGNIIEFTNEQLDELLDEFAAEKGYRIACHKVELFAVPINKPAPSDKPTAKPKKR
ncbi:MAG: transcriptional repressor [Planctomycetota bacterium]|nr:MAG: transcriptional repressor [Planctomycetota bacterium]